MFSRRGLAAPIPHRHVERPGPVATFAKSVGRAALARRCREHALSRPPHALGERGYLIAAVFGGLCAVLAVTACIAADPPPNRSAGPKASLTALRVMPDSIELPGARSQQRVIVIGSFTDGLERDVTRRASLDSESVAVATVADGNRLTAIGPGETRLRAELDGFVAYANVRATAANPPTGSVSFVRDIEAMFTRHGCNTSACHAGVKGRGGFRLSLNGQNPREDYTWVVQGGVFKVLTDQVDEPRQPRIDRGRPEHSLLLRKPTMTEPHEGGLRFERGSPDYQLVVQWIQSQCAFDTQDTEARISELTAFPRLGVVEVGADHAILVTATTTDGTKVDLTNQVHYLSSNPDVLRVGEDGVVHAVGVGEAFVTIRAPRQTTHSRLAVIAHGDPDAGVEPGPNRVDQRIFAKLGQLQLRPSPLCNDAEFLRRVCLDLTGTLPPPERTRQFLTDTSDRRRERLVDVLLETPEFDDFWTFQFAQLLRVRGASHPEHGYAYEQWLRRAVMQRLPLDQIARERIAGQGFQGPSRHLPTDDFDAGELMSEEVRVFWGRRLECARCHDHPFESWTQQQFWGLAGYFGQLSRTDWPGFAATVIFDDPDGMDPDYGDAPESVRVRNPRTRADVPPTFLDGEPLPAGDRRDPRMRLAERMTAHPYFAEAMANRVWSLLMGQGLVNPVDDLRNDNPATHPELLADLAQELRDHRFDWRHLVRLIVLSRAYQLSSEPTERNRDDSINYSHHLPRPLPAEVLLDAISAVSGVPSVFENSHQGQAPLGTRAIQLVVPDNYHVRFLEVNGRASRERLPESGPSPNLAQALHLLAGPTFTDRLTGQGSTVARWLAAEKSNEQVIDELYLSALTRFPTQDEREALAGALTDAVAMGGSREDSLADILWAVLASREFATNH